LVKEIGIIFLFGDYDLIDHVVMNFDKNIECANSVFNIFE